MAKHGTVTFKGASGQSYQFTAYSRDTTFNEVGAIYFMTKRGQDRSGGFSHTRIYVGQTGNLANRPLNHHRKSCFDREGANCVCVFTEDDEDIRRGIERDLINNFDLPCNRE